MGDFDTDTDDDDTLGLFYRSAYTLTRSLLDRDHTEGIQPTGADPAERLAVIERARSSCRNVGIDPSSIFLDARKYSEVLRRTGLDVQMLRYGCYMVALNGDRDRCGRGGRAGRSVAEVVGLPSRLTLDPEPR